MVNTNAQRADARCAIEQDERVNRHVRRYWSDPDEAYTYLKGILDGLLYVSPSGRAAVADDHAFEVCRELIILMELAITKSENKKQAFNQLGEA